MQGETPTQPRDAPLKRTAADKPQQAVQHEQVLLAERAIVRIGIALLEAFNGSSPLMTKRGRLHVGGYPIGSGWFFTETGLLVTCEHVRNSCRTKIDAAGGGCFVVCPYLGSGQSISWEHAWEADVVAHTGPHDGEVASTTAEASAVALSSRVDAAVLRLRCELVTQVPVRRDAIAVPQVNQPIDYVHIGTSTSLQHLQDLYCLGFPGAGGLATPTPTKGSYSGRDPGADGGWLKYDGRMLAGHSGGPFVTADGLVVGWNVRGVGQYDGGLTHAKPVEAARECIERALACSPKADGSYFVWSELLARADGELLAKRQRTEPSAGVHLATESASAASGNTAAVHDHQVHTLIFVCNPERAPLPSAHAEADAVQQCFAPHGRRAIVQHGGDAAKLRELLGHHQPRILHYIGHADAKHPLNKELTLGFTASDGALITILPETVLEVLTSLSATSFLELVVLNGCCSITIAKKVAAAGIPAICWDTVVDDKPAAAFGPPLYEHLLQHAEKPLYESLPAAFQQAVLAVKALAGTKAKANGDRSDGYALADPAAQPRNSTGGILGTSPDGSGRQAAGLPVLISRVRFPPAKDGATRLPSPRFPAVDSTNGRDEQIGLLHEHFFPVVPGALSAAPARQAVLQAIRGLGGIGKV